MELLIIQLVKGKELKISNPDPLYVIDIKAKR